jgi:hypothetical protein
LREQAERALASARGRRTVEPILERLLRVASPGSDSAVFAHRCLAEYRVEEHPWRALLHLRHVLAAHPDDDVAHAMAGLAHAMSGNYRSAVAAYRAALAASPQNPWYHHNAGHLLDVALDRPSRALPHLRAANEALGRNEPEIAASLVHCLARLGERGRAEARELVTSARREHPDHGGLSNLAKELGPPSRPSSKPPERATAARATASRDEGSDAVLASLRARLGASSNRFRAAERVWARYVASRERPLRVRAASVGVLAAAVDYAVARRESDAATVDVVARAYGVSPRSVTQRYQDIARLLEAES